MGDGEVAWSHWHNGCVLFLGGTEEEDIIAGVHPDVDGCWFCYINPLQHVAGGFPTREAARRAAEAALLDAQRRAERKITRLVLYD